VIVSASYSFSDSLIDTLIKRNVNPLEPLAEAVKLMAASVYELDGPDRINN
jgi:hypothetical protein